MLIATEQENEHSTRVYNWSCRIFQSQQ